MSCCAWDDEEGGMPMYFPHLPPKKMRGVVVNLSAQCREMDSRFAATPAGLALVGNDITQHAMRELERKYIVTTLFGTVL